MRKEIEALARAYQAVTNPQPIQEGHFKVGDKVEYTAPDGGEHDGEVVKLDEPQKGAYYNVKLENGKTVKATSDQLELEDDDDEDEDEDMKEAKMDPVGQADADINNDGKVDGTDKYLHKRRKAIGKAMKKDDTATMNPKVSQSTTSEAMKSADKKPEEYTDEKGKKRTRMVPVDKEVTKESVQEERQDTAHHIAKTLRKMGVRHDAKEHEILPKIPHALKKHGLHNNKLIKRDRNFQGDVIDSLRGMKESVMKESFSKTVKSISASYQSMYKKEEETEVKDD